MASVGQIGLDSVVDWLKISRAESDEPKKDARLYGEES
jgi:hypothetical protein